MKKQRYSVLKYNTKNIGDDIQSLAAIKLLSINGINKYSFIDREKLHKYDGPETNLIMNGWFLHRLKNFPPSDKIKPIFISFHAQSKQLINQNKFYFKAHEPIGCRDIYTRNLLLNNGIDAYLSGCLTLIFDPCQIKGDNIYMVDVNSDCDYIPNVDFNYYDYFNDKFIEIKHDMFDGNFSCATRINMAIDLLNIYARAKLVITSRLHCALPCRALNTNCIFLHKNYNTDKRFLGLKEILNGGDTAHENVKGNKDSLKNMKYYFLNYKLK